MLILNATSPSFRSFSTLRAGKLVSCLDWNVSTTERILVTRIGPRLSSSGSSSSRTRSREVG